MHGNNCSTKVSCKGILSDLLHQNITLFLQIYQHTSLMLPFHLKNTNKYNCISMNVRIFIFSVFKYIVICSVEVLSRGECVIILWLRGYHVRLQTRKSRVRIPTLDCLLSKFQKGLNLPHSEIE